MAATPKRKHSKRRSGKRKAARILEVKKAIKNLNPAKNKHLRSLSGQN